MEVNEQIKTLREFIEANYEAQLLETVRKGNNFMLLDFFELTKFNPEIAEELLDHPEEILKAGELAVKEFDLPKKVLRFHLRFTNLPESQRILISEIRSKHLTKLLWMEGVVRQKSDVRPHVMAARFECPSCGNILTVLQLESKYREPSRCGCGRKGKFKELTKELVDGQGIVLEEAPEDLDGGTQPKRMNVFLKNDLVSPLTDRKTSPGNKVRVVGWVTEVPIELRSGGKSTKFDLIIEANFIEPVQEDFSSLLISDEEKEKIINMSKDPNIYRKLVESSAPSIYGHDKVKEALILQLVGGCRKKRKDGVVTRGDMHVLLIGDPGAAKSQLLKRIAKIAPKARYVSGKGVSGAGLCVAPDSMIMTNPGGINSIHNIIEERLIGINKEFVPGVWKKDHIQDIKIQSFSSNLKLHAQNPASIWKLKSPRDMFQIELSSGKKIEITGNTKLLQIIEGKLSWTKSKELVVNQYLATPRKLIGGDITEQYIIDLIDANPVIHNIKIFVKKVVKKLKTKYGSTRLAAQALNIKENNFYHSWVNESARGNIKLNNLKKICEDINSPWKEFVHKVSLYNGKNHKIPKFLTKDLLYLAGLIAGDGDLRVNNRTGHSIRLSSSSPMLINAFKNVVINEFGLNIDIQKGNQKRPTSIRTNSKILQQVLISLGIPLSPKSNKIYLSDTLLHLSNNLLAAYIAGLYDADGSISNRKTKGSNTIELTTCSEKLAKQLQIVFLRFDIHSSIRSRKPSTGRIKGKYTKWIIEIRGIRQHQKFQKHFNLKHPKKAENLFNLAQKENHPNTNIDIIPEINEILKSELIKQKISLKKSGFHRNNISRTKLQEILSCIDCSKNEAKELQQIAFSDIFWEKIKSIKKVPCNYDYVYDFTVKNSHNFVVDGVLVHNTASVVKDEFLGGWSLEAGALVLANKGFVMIDEMDKMSKEDRSAMHEALEQQTVSISKANIQATLRCETTVLAAANPKFGRFDPYGLVAEQINLPPALINRFDLIFPIKDLPDKKKDELLADHILRLHQNPDGKKVEIDTDLLKKYITYVRTRIQPILTDEAIEEIKHYYVQMRNSGQGDEAGIKSVPITARQLEALVRLAEASAKIRLSDKVLKQDSQKAIEMIDFCLGQIARDSETGIIDIDRISSGIPAKERSRISIIREIIDTLENEMGKIIPLEAITERAEGKGLKTGEVEEVIEKLRRGGDLFEPRRGFIQKL